jgi:hypothetical protein
VEDEMPVSMKVIRQLETVEPQLRNVLISIVDELEQSVTSADFSELKEIVRDLASTQKLAVSEVGALKVAVAEMVGAQKETNQRLAEFSKKTDERFAELAVAQKKTEKALQDLTKDHSKTKEQLGGISHTVGYVLENEAYKFLPAMLKREFGLDVKGRLLRDFVKDNRGNEIEVNILGQATRKRSRFVIVGESKSQLSKNKVSEFLNKKLKRLEGIFDDELFPILVTHMKSEPDVDAFAAQKGIKRVYYSYEFAS